MGNVGDLIISIRSDAKGLDKDLKKVEKSTSKFATNLGKAGVAAGAAVAAAAAATLVEVGKLSFALEKSQKELQSELGLTAKEAMDMGNVVKDVYKNNFGESVEDVTKVVSEARRQLGKMSDKELKDVTEGVFAIADSFDADYTQVLNSVNALTDEFGLTSQDALDFIAKGFKKGLNNSDDFLDSIGEYSNLFNDAGFEADEFFSLMETGAASGVLGTDKIADAVKEFSLIANEGSTDVRKAFEAIGLDFGVISKSVNEGDEDWADYFSNVIDGLANVDGELDRDRLLVELFGTQAEDLGRSFIDGLSKVSTTMEDMGGAVDGLNERYNTLDQVGQGLWRRFLIALTPVTDSLIEIANEQMPAILEAFDTLEPFIISTSEALGATLGPALEGTITLLTKFAELAAKADEKLQSLTGGALANSDILGAVFSAFNPLAGVPAALANLPSFATGGIVPGSGPQLIVAHGGERVVPQGDTNTNLVNINGVSAGSGSGGIDEAISLTVQALRRALSDN